MRLEFVHAFFAPEGFTGTAPGRLDVMGGIADYSGSLLLQMPIAEETKVTIFPVADGILQVSTDADLASKKFEISLDMINGLGLTETGAVAAKMPGGDWAVYVLGCFKVLEVRAGLHWKGARVMVQSTVPAGKGVSSSAAIEVATMHAIQKAYGLHIDPLQLSLWAQQVENQVVGAACGLMDQLSVNLGKKNHLLPIICQPHEVFEPIPIPTGVHFAGLDSGVRHAVSGASYGDVRTAAFMGFVIAMKKAGLDPMDNPFQGYLANIPLEQFVEVFMPTIPELISGAAFLEHYGPHIDTVTIVDPSKQYHTRVSALHPVEEQNRIRRFLEIIKTGGDYTEAGQLMLASHHGYQKVGLGETVTNRILTLVRQRGIGHGIAGARISGGGSGGTVTMMITSEEGKAVMYAIRQQLQEETGTTLKVFEGSSDGAHLRL